MSLCFLLFVVVICSVSLSPTSAIPTSNFQSSLSRALSAAFSHYHVPSHHHRFPHFTTYSPNTFASISNSHHRFGQQQIHTAIGDASHNVHLVTPSIPVSLLSQDTSLMATWCTQINELHAMSFISAARSSSDDVFWIQFCQYSTAASAEGMGPVHGSIVLYSGASAKEEIWTVELFLSHFAGQEIVQTLVSYSPFEQVYHTMMISDLQYHNSPRYTLLSLQTRHMHREFDAFIALSNPRFVAKQFADPNEWEIPFPFPVFFRQCDPAWGSDIMTSKTLCQVGCLESSLSVGLRNHGITLPGNTSNSVAQLVDPGTFNTYINQHDGYSQNDLIHTVINDLCVNRTDHLECTAHWDDSDGHPSKKELPLAGVIQYLWSQNHHVVANVNNGHHFVAVIGWNKQNPTQLRVRDSAGSTGREWYSVDDDIVGWRVYHIDGPRNH